MNDTYRHTQIGYLMIVTLAAGVVGLSASVASGSGPKSLMFGVAILGLCLLLFPTLTVIVRSNSVRFFFGLGLVGREIAVTEILTVSVVRNSWTHGWGVRLIPGGWLWNVSGLDAVELRLRNGKLLRIGTDDPVALHAAIANVAKTGQPSPSALVGVSGTSSASERN